jgi:hypothetical protein
MLISAAGLALVLVSLPLFGTPGFATLDARRATIDPVLRRDVGVSVASAADRAIRSRIGYVGQDVSARPIR